MSRKNFFIVLSIILLTTLLNQPVLLQTSDGSDESELKTYEVGGQLTLLRRSDASTVLVAFGQFGFGFAKPPNINEFGIGGRFTYNFNKNIAVETEAFFFPEDKKVDPFLSTRTPEPGGRKFQAVLGPKIGIRKKKFGVFGKVRPGLITFGRYEVINLRGTRENFFILSEKREKVSFFNVDVGGVFEYYPTRKTVLRVDVGDTIIHYNAQKPKDVNPSFTRHNLQTSIGFGFRF